MKHLLHDIREFAANAHNGQKYGEKPYVTHLDAVVATLQRVGYTDHDILTVALLHDVLEDTPITARTLSHLGFPAEVIQGVEFCTDETGHNRKTRKANTYDRVKATGPDPLGLPVKLADRITNIEKGVADNNPSYISMYRKENPAFLEAYTPPEGHPLSSDPKILRLLALIKDFSA